MYCTENILGNVEIFAKNITLSQFCTMNILSKRRANKIETTKLFFLRIMKKKFVVLYQRQMMKVFHYFIFMCCKSLMH